MRWLALAPRSLSVRFAGGGAGAALAILAIVASCGRATRSPEPEPEGSGKQPTPELGGFPTGVWTDEWVNREGKRFVEDVSYRRAALEASLVRHSNTYSAQRLGSYALGDRGWDALPVWNPRSMPITKELAAIVESGTIPGVPEDRAPLWDGVTPTTMAGWIALGRRVFFEFPMRSEVFMEWGLTKRALADEVGVERTADGGVPGLVVFANVDGMTRVGITCAICHSSVDKRAGHEGELVVGSARRRFDYGKLRLEFFKDTRSFVEPELARRMATWGPGRADVTEDNDEDPVAIPDLWGLKQQTMLTQAGTIRHATPLALAIRQDTQLTHSNHQRIRPPRELAWALAMYLYSLEPPRPEPNGSLAEIVRGAGVFATTCSKCHDNEAWGGRAIDATRVGTDPALANGQARGTGTYRISPLVDIARGAPYLHHGPVASLDELFTAARLAPDFKGRFGKPIPGHTFGTELDARGRADLIAFLEIL